MGTYQIAVVARALGKPFYVAVESYKFARMYPMTQRDVVDMCTIVSPPSSNEYLSPIETEMNDIHRIFDEGSWKNEYEGMISFDRSIIDFTPAEYITLLFTDLGVLTPAAVSDELIRLYQ